MSFSNNKPRVFRSKTIGNFFLARIVCREGSPSTDAKKNKAQGLPTPSLLVETYEKDQKVKVKDNKGVEREVPAPASFVFYDLDTVREYDRRVARAKGGTKGDVAAHKFIYAELTSINDAGYAVWDARFSDSKADMSEVVTSKGGLYYAFDEAEREERKSSTGDAPADDKGKGDDGEADDDNVPF